MTNEQNPKYSVGDICKPDFESYVMIMEFLSEKDKYKIKVLSNTGYLGEVGNMYEYGRIRFENRYARVA